MMVKQKRNVGREILAGLREISAANGACNQRAKRSRLFAKKTGLSQARFASVLGVSVRTLQDWEQAAGIHGCRDGIRDHRGAQ